VARVLHRRRASREYTENLLETALAGAQLSAADRGLCQEIVYGVVRWQATLDWLIARKTGGRKVHGKCVKPSRKNAKSRRCTRYLKVGAIRRAGTRGANKLPFSGRIGKTALAPATYRATIVAVGAGGLMSNSRTVSFRIVSR